MTWRTPRCWAMRQAMSPIGPSPSTSERAVGLGVGVGDRLPGGGEHVGEVDETLVGRAVGHLDVGVARLGDAEVLGLPAGEGAVELGVPEQGCARALFAHLGRLALALQAVLAHPAAAAADLERDDDPVPGARPVTSPPTSSTIPMASCPRTSPGVHEGPSGS